MREVTDAEKIRRFMRELGSRATGHARVLFAGGATAVLYGWRTSTIDVDITMVPERDELLRSIPHIKEELRMNVEFASPGDFIPVRSGWEERGVFIGAEGNVSYYHYDLYAQALSKIERGHTQDMADIAEMVKGDLVDRGRLLAYFRKIEPEIYRFPAIDPATFREAVESFAAG